MEQERPTIARVTWRLVSLLIAAYLITYLDRVNISFAAVKMNADIGLSAAGYGGVAIAILLCLSIERTAPVTRTSVHPARQRCGFTPRRGSK